MNDLNQLNELRQDIDALDSKLCSLFVKRMDMVKAVLEEKKKHRLPLYQPNREREVLQQHTQGIDNKVIKNNVLAFLESMMTISKNYQAELLKEKKNE